MNDKERYLADANPGWLERQKKADIQKGVDMFGWVRNSVEAFYKLKEREVIANERIAKAWEENNKRDQDGRVLVHRYAEPIDFEWGTENAKDCAEIIAEEVTNSLIRKMDKLQEIAQNIQDMSKGEQE